MASSTFFIPSVNVIGADSLTDAMNMMADYGFTRTLIVTDNMLTKLGMAGDVQKALEERNIFSVIYDGTQPNPTTENVAAGLKLLKENNCDSVISLGGGSPHDCAKGIAPESNQQSSTSGTRFITPPQTGQRSTARSEWPQ